jgi:glycosyltransferase involved in cell wall biosynthesis
MLEKLSRTATVYYLQNAVHDAVRHECMHQRKTSHGITVMVPHLHNICHENAIHEAESIQRLTENILEKHECQKKIFLDLGSHRRPLRDTEFSIHWLQEGIRKECMPSGVDLFISSNPDTYLENTCRGAEILLHRTLSDAERFQDMGRNSIRKNNMKRAGFFSSHASMLDFEFMADLAELLPQWDFHMAIPGATHDRLPENISTYPNLSYSDLPEFIHNLDLGILPYDMHTEAETLTYELFAFLYASIPVMTTDCREISEEFGGTPILETASSPEEMAEKCMMILENDPEERIFHTCKYLQSLEGELDELPEKIMIGNL